MPNRNKTTMYTKRRRGRSSSAERQHLCSVSNRCFLLHILDSSNTSSSAKTSPLSALNTSDLSVIPSYGSRSLTYSQNTIVPPPMWGHTPSFRSTARCLRFNSSCLVSGVNGIPLSALGAAPDWDEPIAEVCMTIMISSTTCCSSSIGRATTITGGNRR